MVLTETVFEYERSSKYEESLCYLLGMIHSLHRNGYGSIRQVFLFILRHSYLRHNF